MSKKEGDRARTTHVARDSAPTVNLQMEVVSIIEEEYVIGVGSVSVGDHVDDMIHKCMSDHVRMNKLVIDLSGMQREVS